MKISVIVTIYNTIQYLEQCVHSIMSQTFSDYEVIFIDDASTDSSKKLLRTILSEYPTKNNQWTLIENKQNMGVGYCRQLGMKKAKGDYLIHVDSDDYVEITFLEKMIVKAESTKSDIVICNTADVVNDKIYVNNIEHITDKDELIKRLLVGTFHNSFWNKLIKKEIVKNNDIYPDQVFRMMEDKSVMFKYVYFANKVSYVNDVLYYYRKNENSLTSGKQRMLVPLLKPLNRIIDEFFEENKPSETIVEGINLFRCGVAASFLLYEKIDDKLQHFVRNASVGLLMKNTYIPNYYRVALVSYKFRLNFFVGLIRYILRKHSDNDKSR